MPRSRNFGKMVQSVRRPALLAAFGLAVACSDAVDRFQSPYVERVEAIPPFYYRVQASYTLKETGEPIEFDYVVGCGGIATRWTYTSPSRMTSYYPKSMFHPTSNGEAIGVRTPDMCDPHAWGWTDRRTGEVFTAEDTIPDDFLPVTIWYPNVNRMGWGIGYESDVAYDSPYAKIEFNGASITESNQDEWQAWRDRAAAEYQQVGGLPGPWGWQGVGEGSTIAERERLEHLNDGYWIQANFCHGTRRLKLPDSIRADVLSAQPDPQFRFWSLSSIKDAATTPVVPKLRRARGQFNGGDYAEHLHINDQLGVLKKDGGGRVTYRFSEGQYYSDRYPVLVKQPSELWVSEDKTPLREIILLAPEWQGFSFCGFDETTLFELEAYFAEENEQLSIGTLSELTNAEASVEYRRFFVRIEGELVPLFDVVHKTSQISHFFDQEGYLFVQCCLVRG